MFGKQWDRATSITLGRVRLVLPLPLPALALPQRPHLCSGKQVGVEGNPLSSHRGGAGASLGLLWVLLGGSWQVVIRTQPSHFQKHVCIFEQEWGSVPGSGLCPLCPAWAPWVTLPTLQISLTLGLLLSHPFSLSVSAPLSYSSLLLPSLSLGSFLKGVLWAAGRKGLLGQARLG